MLQSVTTPLQSTVGPMPIRIAELDYLTTNEVCDRVGVSRQTLWRWRLENKVPSGRRLRGRQLLFGLQEVEEIERYATHLEPAESRRTNQMSLFNRQVGGRGL